MTDDGGEADTPGEEAGKMAGQAPDRHPLDRGLNTGSSSGFRDLLEQAIEHHVIDEVVSHHDKELLDAVRERAAVRANALLYKGVLAALLETNPNRFQRLLERLAASKMPILDICDDLVLPIAHELGRRWSDDTESFVTIAVAMSRLQRFVTELMAARRGLIAVQPDKRALFARMPGNKHTLGISVISACFAEDGWIVDGGSDLEIGPQTKDLLIKTNYAFFGLSVGSLCSLHDVKNVLSDARTSVPGSRLCIGVGGPGLIGRGGMFVEMGADFEATDLRRAISTADGMMH